MRSRNFKVLALSGCILLLGFSTTITAAPGKGRPYFEKRGEVVWEVPTEEQVIALSFDDGPDPEDTPIILDLLKEYGVKATFFIIGNKAELYPDLVKREADEGHELANHTYRHLYFNKRVSENRLQDELRKTQDAIFKASGQRPHLFRPPGGYYNETLVRIARKEGFTIVMWSWHQNTMDWNTPGVSKITSTVLNNARNGDIVLFHDYVEGQTQTIAALKTILPELKKRGYRFVTISELLSYSKLSPVKQGDTIQ
ncbi:polysaccharide deacetylase family sporulation protein PdaB [Paenibacillus vulneris]|uniref:Polysaccharide deacetylase family protein n=1 Tax=Paenibacillus vulneris TaxID=1133364 RepID=A0ABW3UVB0_9BACL